MIQAESQAWLKNFFSSHAELTIQEKDERIAVLRGIANRAREDAAARSFMEWLVQQAETELPAEARVFKAYYLDGLTARQAGRALHMDKRSVHRCNRRIMEAMLPLAYSGWTGCIKRRESVQFWHTEGLEAIW